MLLKAHKNEQGFATGGLEPVGAGDTLVAMRHEGGLRADVPFSVEETAAVLRSIADAYRAKREALSQELATLG